MLIDCYRERLEGIEINTTEQLIALMHKDERLYYLYLVYAYLADLDLKHIVNYNYAELRISISLLCKEADEVEVYDIRKYYSRFLCTDESSTQASKVAQEIRRDRYKQKLMEQYGDEIRERMQANGSR